MLPVEQPQGSRATAQSYPISRNIDGLTNLTVQQFFECNNSQTILERSGYHT